jgi:hypothetical protein
MRFECNQKSYSKLRDLTSEVGLDYENCAQKVDIIVNDGFNVYPQMSHCSFKINKSTILVHRS